MEPISLNMQRDILEQFSRGILCYPSMKSTFSTIPVIKSSTSGRSFSGVRRLFTYLSEILYEGNNCFVLHVHKELAECINLEDVAKEFISHAFTTLEHY